MSIDDNGRDLPPESPFTVGAAEVPEATPRRNHLVLIAVSLASVVVLAVAGLGTAVVIELGAKPASTSSSGGILRQNPFGSLGSGSGAPGDGSRGFQDGQSIGQQAAAGDSAATPSTAAQEVGVVTINTVLQYERAEQAAGTGMIISSNGYILTNNHVVQSSTSISVTVESTGQTYSATVVGTDATADVAVLKLTGASGLHTVSFAQNEKVTVGEPIYSVGNAEGTGDLVTAVGSVGAVNRSLTIGSDSSAAPENLSGLIELQSDVVSGDSGSPLFDSKGDVIGMVTAASSGSAIVTGYAINIAQVLRVSNAIQSGAASSGILLGYPAFLGVDIASMPSSLGVPVASTFAGMPAARAGIVEGDIITSVNGVAVSTASGLSSTIQSHKVGDTVTIGWLDGAGAAHSAIVTLVAGPAA